MPFFLRADYSMTHAASGFPGPVERPNMGNGMADWIAWLLGLSGPKLLPHPIHPKLLFHCLRAEEDPIQVVSVALYKRSVANNKGRNKGWTICALGDVQHRCLVCQLQHNLSITAGECTISGSWLRLERFDTADVITVHSSKQAARSAEGVSCKCEWQFEFTKDVCRYQTGGSAEQPLLVDIAQAAELLWEAPYDVFCVQNGGNCWWYSTVLIEVLVRAYAPRHIAAIVLRQLPSLTSVKGDVVQLLGLLQPREFKQAFTNSYNSTKTFDFKGVWQGFVNIVKEAFHFDTASKVRRHAIKACSDTTTARLQHKTATSLGLTR